MASADCLRMALQTGSIYTAGEEHQKLTVSNHDIGFIINLGQNSVAMAARDAIWHHRAEPETVVDALTPHIQQLLDAGNQIAPQNTGQLQLGYDIDAISAALVKLKRWDESRYWLELFFNLDAHYQDRLPKSEKEKMLKRLERCKSPC